jgi:hypothetical protein
MNLGVRPSLAISCNSNRLFETCQIEVEPYGGIDWMLPGFINQDFYSKNNWRKNPGKSRIDPAYWRKVVKFDPCTATG